MNNQKRKRPSQDQGIGGTKHFTIRHYSYSPDAKRQDSASQFVFERFDSSLSLAEDPENTIFVYEINPREFPRALENCFLEFQSFSDRKAFIESVRQRGESDDYSIGKRRLSSILSRKIRHCQTDAKKIREAFKELGVLLAEDPVIREPLVDDLGSLGGDNAVKNYIKTRLPDAGEDELLSIVNLAKSADNPDNPIFQKAILSRIEKLGLEDENPDLLKTVFAMVDCRLLSDSQFRSSLDIRAAKEDATKSIEEFFSTRHRHRLKDWKPLPEIAEKELLALKNRLSRIATKRIIGALAGLLALTGLGSGAVYLYNGLNDTHDIVLCSGAEAGSEKTGVHPLFLSEIQGETLKLNRFSKIAFPIPSCEGYQFNGWTLEGSDSFCTGIGIEGGMGLSQKEMRFYPSFTPIQYSINYLELKADRPSSFPASFTRASDTFSLPTEVESLGFAFTKWTLPSGDPIEEIPFGTVGDIDVTANWDICHYSVQFRGYEGVNPAFTADIEYRNDDFSYTVNAEEKDFNDAYCPGYRFLGWYEGETKITKLDPMAARNMVLTPRFSEIEYPVDYSNLEGVGNPNPTTYKRTNGNVPLESISRLGYDFLRWEYGGSPISSLSFEGLRLAEKTDGTSISLAAIWAAKSYQITYSFVDSVSGEPISGVTNGNVSSFTHSESGTITLVNPIASGYRFEGWFLKDGASLLSITKISKTWTRDVEIVGTFVPTTGV